MAMNHRVFISFAIEDEWARIRMGGQAKNERSPFEFTDMSVKKPWDEAWKTRCRTRIRGCDGMIAMVSGNTRNADGQLWELRIARAEGIPILGIYTTTENRPGILPTELNGVRVTDWSWTNIAAFLNRL